MDLQHNTTNTSAEPQSVDTRGSVSFNDYLSEAGKFVREIFKRY